MAVKLNHTIVHARDQRAAATFLAEILGLPAPRPFGPFLAVQAANEVTLDYLETEEPLTVEHYAFAVSDEEFDAIFARVKGRSIRYWADPGRTREGETNDWNGGRGFYFEDPSGHLMEVLTRP